MQVDEYKNLGTIIRSTKRKNPDLFYRNFSFIGDKARKAICGLQKKLKCIKALPTEIRFDIFDTMIRPIITYTSDVWGLNKSGLNDLDELFLQYLRCVLCVKATTSNAIVVGECGKFPSSMYCHANVLCYLHRLLTMQPGIVKSVFNSLHDLTNQGFSSWVSRSNDLAESYQIDKGSWIDLSLYQFKELCHERLKNSFIMSWMTDLRNGCESSSILRTYSLYKMNFGTECYLKHISKPKFRIALSKMRASLHDLEVERGRYGRPKLDITERLCILCHVIKDEEHFVTDCVTNREMRKSFFEKNIFTRTRVCKLE